MRSFEDWEYGAFQFHNPARSTLTPYFDLVDKLRAVAGDIVEFGVWQGASLITTALLLESQQSEKKIFGFDTFKGFPSYSEEDNFNVFFELAESGKITKDHLERIVRNAEYLSVRGKSLTPSEVSGSADFSATSMSLVLKKIDFLSLNSRVRVIDLDLNQLVADQLPRTISLALLDLDLYGGYKQVLPLIWDRISPGGQIYLDEYYSLKFPGPRVAVDEFCLQFGIMPTLLDKWWDFERWVLIKT